MSYFKTWIKNFGKTYSAIKEKPLSQENVSIAFSAYEAGRKHAERRRKAMTQWQPISSLPEEMKSEVLRVGWHDSDGWNETLDYLEDEVWQDHANHLEFYNNVSGGVAGSVGPKEQAPYQYWMPLPLPPKEREK